MKLFVLSDLHLEHAPVAVRILSGVDVVVLAGDIGNGAEGIRWAQRMIPALPVVFVAGNHEFHGREIGAALVEMHAVAAGSNVRVLEQESVVIEGVRFLGATLWTDFALNATGNAHEVAWAMAEAAADGIDFDGRIHCADHGMPTALTPELAAHRHRAAVDWLEAWILQPFPGKTVVVTHHAPSPASLPSSLVGGRLAPACASRLERFASQVDLWVHGHIHEACDYRLGHCRVICNPLGYPGEAPAFRPGLFDLE